MTMNKMGSNAKALARTFTISGLAAIGIAGCAATMTPSAATVASSAPPQLQTVGEILKSDPRFTDYVRIIDFAGLGQKLDADRDVTVFAPTNAAFAHSDRHWRATANPDSSAVGGAWEYKRQALIEQSFLDGVHPPAEFAGQTQDVRARNGSIFHVDGRKPDVISITMGPTARVMGSPRSRPQVASAELPPIMARDGIIYPVNNILLR